MFGFFTKKYWYYFYLPAELFYSIPEINNQLLKANFLHNKLHFNKVKVLKISDYLYQVSISFITTEDLGLFEKYISKYREIIPPWLAFPNLFQGSPRWNQGIQEDFAKSWIPYWKSLNGQQKYEYMLKYKCPTEWEDWLIENIG